MVLCQVNFNLFSNNEINLNKYGKCRKNYCEFIYILGWGLMEGKIGLKRDNDVNSGTF